MARLKIKVRKHTTTQVHEHTPFIRGISEAGSVDMDASSRKTTGKSITLRAELADEMQVVQIYTRWGVRDFKGLRCGRKGRHTTSAAEMISLNILCSMAQILERSAFSRRSIINLAICILSNRCCRWPPPDWPSFCLASAILRFRSLSCIWSCSPSLTAMSSVGFNG